MEIRWNRSDWGLLDSNIFFLDIAALGTAREIPETLVFAEIFTILHGLRQDGAQGFRQHQRDHTAQQCQYAQNGQGQETAKASLLAELFQQLNK